MSDIKQIRIDILKILDLINKNIATPRDLETLAILQNEYVKGFETPKN